MVDFISNASICLFEIFLSGKSLVLEMRQKLYFTLSTSLVELKPWCKIEYL